MSVKRFCQKIGVFKRIIGSILDDCLALSGAVAISYGAYQIYAPLGWIVAGVFLIVAAMLWGRAGAVYDTE